MAVGRKAAGLRWLLGLALFAACAPPPDAGPPPSVRLAWPLGGEPGRDWILNNYVDLEPGAAIRDYRGGGRTYDRHQGADLNLPSFRWMDRGVPVLAAAAGTVTATHDGEFDRNVACGFLDALAPPNLVEVTHADGTRARYVHLRRGSVGVTVGEAVAAGAVLGEVGSSGCSTAPHLHFEVLSAAGEPLDPFLESLWLDPPPYDRPLTVMDHVIKNGPIESDAELKDPGPNAARPASGSPLGIGLSLGGGFPGDRIEVRLPGAASPALSAVLGDGPPHRYRFWNVPAAAHRGALAVTVHVNGRLLLRHDFEPPESSPGSPP